MSTSNYTKFKELAETKKPVVITQTIPADHIAPMAVFENLTSVLSYGFLSERNESHPHQIFMSFEPRGVFKFNRNGYNIELDGKLYQPAAELLNALKEFQQTVSVTQDIPIGLAGVLVGFMNYDSVRLFEKRLQKLPTDLHHPEFTFYTYKINLVFDTQNQTLTLSVVTDSTGDLQKNYDDAINSLQQLIDKINTPLEKRTKSKNHHKFQKSIQSNISNKMYESLVNTAKSYINQGEVFQVVLSRSFKQTYTVTPFEIYRSVRRITSVPYLFFFDNGDEIIIGASPEKLVSVQQGRVETVPIAGTCKDTGSAAIDALLSDEKECAEHTMLVDLSRNDLGKVCKPGTVRIESYMQPKKAGNLIHLTTLVTGELLDQQHALDALKAVFPAGTLSGAPKIRAMEIIDELEQEPRGLYGGALCFLDNQGNLDSAIVIRTMALKDGIATLRAGAGIVFDSIPEKEAQESLAKASSILRAIHIAQEETL